MEKTGYKLDRLLKPHVFLYLRILSRESRVVTQTDCWKTHRNSSFNAASSNIVEKLDIRIVRRLKKIIFRNVINME